MNDMLCILLLEPVIPIWLIVVCGIVFFWLSWKTYAACAIGKKERILTHLDHIRAIERRHDEDCREEIEEYVATHRWAPEDDNPEGSPKP